MICKKSVYRKSIFITMISAICVSLFSAVAMTEETASAASNTPIAVFPLTTKSPEARRLVEEVTPPTPSNWSSSGIRMPPITS
jgi:hypothetical protein